MAATSACELFRRCLARRGGDEWREFHRRYNPRIRRTVLRAFRQRGVRLVEPDLDEFVQDLYCRLLTAPGRRFRGRSEPQLWTYLDRVARSVALDHRRASRAAKRRAQVVAPGGGGEERDRPENGRPRDGTPQRAAVPEAIDEMAARQVSPEERCLIREYGRLVGAGCRKHSCNDRAVTVLRLAILEGWSSPEISRRLGGAMTPGQVDLLVCRLKRRLAKEGLKLPCRRERKRPPRTRPPPAPGSGARGPGRRDR